MSPQEASTSRSRFTSWFVDTFSHRMFRDRLFLSFIVAAALLCLVIVVLSAFQLRPKDVVVPLQYSSVQGFNVLGEWYRNFIFPFFSLLVTGGNLALAHKSFEKSRLTSFFLVFGAVVVNVLVLVVFIVLISHIEA